MRTEIEGHFPGQRRQCRLGRGVGDPRKRVNLRAGDRGDIDDAALGRLQLVKQTPTQQRGGEQIDVEHLDPGAVIRLQHTHAPAVLGLR